MTTGHFEPISYSELLRKAYDASTGPLIAKEYQTMVQWLNGYYKDKELLRNTSCLYLERGVKVIYSEIELTNAVSYLN